MSESENRDFLSEARQSAELARAMSDISALTASATASIAKLQVEHTTDPVDVLTFEPPPPLPSSSSSSSREGEGHRYNGDAMNSTAGDDYEYPDMSKYYSNTDYAASLPSLEKNTSSSSSSFGAYSSGISSFFSRNNSMPSESSSSSSSDYGGSSSSSSSSSSNGDEEVASGDPSKYEPRKKVAVSNSYPSSPSSSSSSSRLRKCYLSLACLFAMLLIWDSLPQTSLHSSQSFEGDEGNGGLDYDDKAGSGTNQSSAVLSSVLGGKSSFWGRKSPSRGNSRLPRASVLARGVKGGASAAGVKQKKKKREALMKLMSFGKHGASPGRFNSPRGLLIVRNRFLLVSDFANKRIQMLFFRSSADLIVDSQSLSPGDLMQQSTKMKSAVGGGSNGGTVGEGEDEEGEGGGDRKIAGKNAPEPVFEYALEMDQVGGPWEMAALDDFVFVAEWGMHRIKILRLDSKTGQLQAEGFFGAFGYADEPGKFNHPRGIACQKSTRFVIVSDENDRLQVLKFNEWPSPSLTFVSSFGRSSTTLPPNEKHNNDGGRSDALGFFRRPAGLALHPDSGLLFVADSKNHRLQTLRLTLDGKLNPVAKFGAGAGFTFKTEPESVALHPTHPLLLVTEQGTQCLHELLINPGGQLTLRRSHCGQVCSASVSQGAGHLRLAGSRAPGPTFALLVKDLVLVTAGDQVMLLKWRDWTLD